MSLAAPSRLRWRCGSGNPSGAEARSLAQFEHAEDGFLGAGANVFGEMNLRLQVEESVVEFLERVHLHVTAIGAGALAGGAGDEAFVRDFALEAMQHAGLGDDDEGVGWMIATVMDHFLGGTDFVGEHAHRVGAFRVGDDGSVGILLMDAGDAVAGELDMDVAGALPEVHFTAGLLHDPGAEVLIGDKQDGAVLRGGLDDFDRIAAGADAIAEGFDVGAAVDVGDDVVVFGGVGLEEGFQLGAGAALLEGAAGIGVGQDDDLTGIDDLGGFRHEMDAAEGDDIGVGLFGFVGQAEGVADEISDFLDVAGLVIVGQDEGIALFFEAQDFVLEGEGCGGDHGGGAARQASLGEGTAGGVWRMMFMAPLSSPPGSIETARAVTSPFTEP
jgi:hypothetical protein